MLHTFEDTICWQMARDLSTLIYQSTKKIADDFLGVELRTAGLTAMSNIAKGTAFSEEEDFSRCYEISITALFKIENMTYILEGLDIMEPEIITEIRKDAVETKKVTIAFYEFRTGKQIFKDDDDDDDDFLPPMKDSDLE